MKKLTFIIFSTFSAVLFWGCEEDKITSISCDQGVMATVKDLTGLDGCGFVFELNDGTRLEPIRLMYCGTPPLPKEVTKDPLYDFEFVDGKQVRMGYEEINDAASICMVGKIVRITCIEEITLEENQ
jgi:hypothetical protein